MKRTLFVISSLFSVTLMNAQEPADALRFSWTTPSGTARQQAIGGAMGSLGGDLSALYVNPAGLAFYKTGDFTLSPSHRFARNKATYFDRQESAKDKAFTFGTSGVAWGSGRQGRKVRNVAFGLGFNTSASFKSDILYRGANHQSSYSQKYLEEIRNSGLKDSRVAEEFPYGTSLAVNTYWIDTVGGGSSGNYDFQSRSANILSTGLLQEQNIRNRGGIYEFALGVAANFNDRILFGGSLGIPIASYEREASFTEVDATNDPNNQFDFATVEEHLRTTGAGVNLKAGIIFKPQESWRLGLAIHSPTVYALQDNFDYLVTANVEGSEGTLYQSSLDFPDASSEFRYLLVTPYKVLGSISYVLREIQDVTRQKGFITADVEFVNHKASSFKPDEEDGYITDESTKEYLRSLNRAIDNAYKPAFNFRLGGELKFTTLMVRAGAAYYGNPYKNINGEKGSRLNLTGGLGYRDKGMFIDLAYVHSINKDMHFPYRLESAPYSGARIRTTGGNVLATIGFKF